MDYTIPWKYLPEDDADFFDQAGIERGASFIKFKHELSRKDLASVCSRLWNFQNLIPDATDNHIAFAIGDAFNEYSNRFGEEDGKYFMDEFIRLSALRDKTLKITGGALIYLQIVEHQIKGCCAMLKLKGINLTLEDFQSADINRRRQTLGQLKKALIDTFPFTETFASQFDDLVKKRNEFVHSLWTGDMKMDERGGLPSADHLNKKLEFTISLMRQARSIELVFRGLLGAIVESMAEHLKDHEVVIPWKKYNIP